MTDPVVLRLLDANLNRAREALRVIEDYARFALDDAELCERLKRLRHHLSETTRTVAIDAIFHRDTPGDVGTELTTESEGVRHDAAHVVTAAGKRLGEALRCIEEFLKIDDPPRAVIVERLRYDFYDIENELSLSIRPAISRFADVRLYVLITESACSKPWVDAAEEAIAGGADCLQLREKQLDGAELLSRARRLVELCKKHKVVSIINDRADITILSGADGVHLGQSDLSAREARKLVGTSKLIGVSTHNIEQARQAVRDGADYIGVGPIFKSATKPRDFVAGLEFAEQVAAEIKIPSVAIAGINAQNVDEVLKRGMSRIAVTAAVVGANDISAAARTLKAKLD